MAILNDLTDELLVEVIKFSAWHKTALLTVATVNKKLNGLATQILARDVVVYVQTQDAALARKYDILMSSLDRRPGLNVCVQSVTIKCREDGSRKNQRKKDANVRANELLKRLPKIKSVCIDWEDRNSIFVPNYLSRTGHPHLREVTFLGWKTSLSAIYAYMGVPSISSLVATAIDPGSPSKCITQSPAGSDGPNLSLLELRRTHLPHSELYKIHGLASSIATLRCASPGLEDSTGLMLTRRVRTTMKSTFSPALTAQALAPLQACLVELKLGDGVATNWPGHDGTQLDLSKFTCLRRLDVMSTCFFKDSPKAQARGLRDLLPRCLEELTLWFPFGSHFLYSDDELPQWFPNEQYSHRLESQHSSRYAWLTEIVEANILDNSSFNLRKVTIEEEIKGPKGFGYDGYVWELPSHLRRICAAAELVLTVWLRKPKFPGCGLN